MFIPSEAQSALFYEARKALKLHTNVEFAKFLGVSARTISRHPGTAGIPIGDYHEQIVRAVHPVNRDLAAKLARTIGTDLVQLGLELPKALPVPEKVLPVPKKDERAAATADHATLVVCTAADALNMLPRDVRPALATIFTYARSLRVDLEGLAKLLSNESDKPKRVRS